MAIETDCAKQQQMRQYNLIDTYCNQEPEHEYREKNVSKVTHPVERHTEVVSYTSGNQSILHGFISDYQVKQQCLHQLV